MMKTHSYHFILKGKADYKDLVPVFPDILKTILAENDHFQSDEDEESREMFIDMNMADLELNRKPEGYNRKGKYRLIFPIGSKEFYITSTVAKPSEVKKVGDRIKEILSTASSIKFETSAGDEEID